MNIYFVFIPTHNRVSQKAFFKFPVSQSLKGQRWYFKCLEMSEKVPCILERYSISACNLAEQMNIPIIRCDFREIENYLRHYIMYGSSGSEYHIKPTDFSKTIKFV